MKLNKINLVLIIITVSLAVSTIFLSHEYLSLSEALSNERTDNLALFDQMQSLNDENDDLKEADLYVLELNWTAYYDSERFAGCWGYVDIEGIVFNAGCVDAPNISAEFTLYRGSVIIGSVKYDGVWLGSISAKEYVTFHHEVGFNATSVTNVEVTFTGLW